MGRTSMHNFLIADPRSWKEDIRTVNGQPVTLLAVQRPRRSGPKRRKKRTFYMYKIKGREECVWRNTNPSVPVYRPTGFSAATRQAYIDAFMPRGGTRSAAVLRWLEDNDYELAAGA